MGDPLDDRRTVHRAALALLALGAWLHYGWALFPPEWQAQVWNISGSVARVALLLAVAWHRRSVLVMLVCAWWVAEELMVSGCSLAYIVRPWVVPPGEAQCSALAQFDLGRIGLVIMLSLLAVAVRKHRVNQP